MAWCQGRGYFAQWRVAHNAWVTIGPDRRTTPEVDLDCKLNARAGKVSCLMHPTIANLTPGRPEYEHDPEGPYPWAKEQS